MSKASLYGIKKSNRDFSKKNSWGKNQFNSSFPTSLCAYMASKKLNSNYLTVKSDGEFCIDELSIQDLFGLNPCNEDDIFYAFESAYSPYNTFVTGTLPRTDLVIQNSVTKACLRGLEVKLTALPDNTTCNKRDNLYGSEIVIRPDTIVYLACSLIDSLNGIIPPHIFQNVNINDWEDPQEIIDNAAIILSDLKLLISSVYGSESPVLVQPVWKTKGKVPVLSDNCLDVFVWSNIGLTRFIHEISKSILTVKNPKITRQYRTAVWLFKMVYDYSINQTFDHESIIDKLSFNVKNDKAFASSGTVTNSFMSCNNLTKPRIKQDEIKNIILNNGQDLLSPERRFDAIIFNSPNLFK
jgi:hypothetical protein